MKEKLLALIDEADDIEKQFHIVGADTKGFPSVPVINDQKEFQRWKAELEMELQDIVNRTNDPYISETLAFLKKSFNGWTDKKSFRDMQGKLSAIKNVADKYYTEGEPEPMESGHEHKIFISHSSRDKDYVSELVTLLEDMGLDENTVFCSSLPGYGIPIDTNIFDYLREQFLQYDLHVLFVHSENYYKSPVSLNEMGAAWALKSACTSFLLPGFKFEDMKGVVNGDTIAIKLDADDDELKDKIDQLYDTVTSEFGVPRKTGRSWEKRRDSFITKIKGM